MARGPDDTADLDADSLRSELRRARARLEEQRMLLGEAHRHALATGRFTQALSELSRSKTLERSGLTAALVELVTAASECLEVARVGVWLADETFERLECAVLVHQGVVSRRPGTVIDRALYPSYFEAIDHARVVAADDVLRSDATRELIAGYLTPLGITSLLDAPVRVFGNMVGIVCYEHLGPPRVWSEAEQAFAAHLGDFVALAVEAVRREDARRAELEAETRYRHLVENLPATLYRLEPGKGIAFVSRGIIELTGRPPSEWQGVDGLRAWIDRVHPDDRDLVRERLRGNVAQHDPGIEYRIVGPDRTERWVHDVSHALRGRSGDVVAIEGVLNDVTERANASAKTHEWERRFQSLFRHGELAMVTLDQKGCVTFASEGFSTLMRKTQLEILDRPMANLFGNDRDAEALEASLTQLRHGISEVTTDLAVPSDAELRALGAMADSLGARGRALRFHWTPLHEGTASASDARRVIGAIGVGIDVTPLVERAARTYDRDKEASLSRLAAGVAHDLNNVLAAVRLTASVLSRTDDAAMRGEALDNLTECSREASELTQRLMDVARARPTQATDLEVDAELERVLPLLRALLGGSSVTLDAQLDAPTAWVRIGETELRQILLNLIANARDVAPPGTAITLRSARLTLPSPRVVGYDLVGGEFVAIEVEDRGPGFDPALGNQLFEPYFSTKTSSGSAHPSHRGLGLASSRGLARQAGGELRAESTPNGARMILLLPRAAHAAAPHASSETQRESR
jgi:PAS domain S-box-containing protein